MIHRIANGQGKESDLKDLDEIAGNIMGRTICALGDAAAMPVQSFIKHFKHEFEAKIQQAVEQQEQTAKQAVNE